MFNYIQNDRQMKVNKFKQILGVVLLSSLVFANAQGQEERLTREMTLEREYDPTIQDANKVNRLPEVKEPDITRRAIEYSTSAVPTDPDKEFVVLPSGDIMTAIQYNNRRGYFNFGGGMYMNLNGDFGYHLLNNEKDKLNIYVSHRSMDGKPDYILVETKQKAVFNDNLVGIDFKHYFNPAVLRIGANYGYSLFNYYGLPFGLWSSSSLYSDDSLADYKTKQVNQTINAYAGIQSKEDTYIGYMLDVDFVRFSQKYGMIKTFDGISENKYTIRAGLSTRLGDGNQLAGMAGKLNIFNYSNPVVYDSESLNYKNYMEATITPYYRINGDNWKAQLGLNLMMITGDSSKIFLSPNISIEAEIANKTVFFASAEGEIQSNDAYSLSKRNRYMNYSLMTTPSRTWLDAMLGIRTGVIPNVWFELFAGYKITENEVFFIPSLYNYYNTFLYRASSSIPLDTPVFSSYYTTFQPDVSLFRAGATLKYKYRDVFDISVKGVYNYWTLRAGDGMAGNFDDVKPFGRPAIEINADLTIRPIEPLSLIFGYYLGADRYTGIFDNSLQPFDQNNMPYREIKMKNINDLNFTTSWTFNETFGAYVKLNNLLFQKQELYYGYPMLGFNAMLGINLNF